MFRRVLYDAHLYIGLILSLMILMLSITGFYLNHQHDWFHKQNVEYMHPEYEAITELAINSAQEGKKVIPEAVEIALDSNRFTLDEIQSVNYASHGLGYFYYVHLNNQQKSIAVITESGEVAKIYHDSLVTKWMTDLHVGLVDSFNFIWANDLTTIGIIFLTLSGIFLSIRILKGKMKKRKKAKRMKY